MTAKFAIWIFIAIVLDITFSYPFICWCISCRYYINLRGDAFDFIWRIHTFCPSSCPVQSHNSKEQHIAGSI